MTPDSVAAEVTLQNLAHRLQNSGELTVTEWSLLISDLNEIKGWNKEGRDQAEWAALAHSEISEAYEEHRKGHAPGFVYASVPEKSEEALAQMAKPEGQAIEWADLMIRALHWFAYHDLDPEKYLRMKFEYNMTRPYRHGGKIA